MAAFVLTEFVEQTRLVTWCQAMEAQYPELGAIFHIPNGSKAHVSYRVKLKQLGLQSGVPDLCLPCPRGPYHGLYIEMKRLQGSSTSKDQKEWHVLLQRYGYAVGVAKGWVMGSAIITDYLNLPTFQYQARKAKGHQ